MNKILPSFAVILLLVALLLPSVGPLLDHHFAERQPSHRHVALAGFHVHTHSYEDTWHAHGPGAQGDDGTQSGVVFNYDSGPLVTTVTPVADTAVDSFFQFEPTSIFLLPLPKQVLLRPSYASPPDQPPRHLA